MGCKHFIWLETWQKLQVNNFELIKDTSEFNRDFTKNYNNESDQGYFFEVDVQYTERLFELHNDFFSSEDED